LSLLVTDLTNVRELRFSSDSLTKKYLLKSSDELDLLEQFYQKCAGVTFLEKGKRVSNIRNMFSRTFELRPVGRPVNILTELELKTAIRCIVTALHGIHSLGWTFNDIRWSNVISVGDDFFLIDSEFARPIGSPYFSDFTIRDPFATACTVSSDLYMVRCLFKSYTSFVSTAAANVLIGALDDPEQRSILTASNVLEFDWFKEN
jgi:hypothetical protein